MEELRAKSIHFDHNVVTFTDMFRLNIAQIKLPFKLPRWIVFQGQRQRKDQASLTQVERDRFLGAFNMINSNGMLGTMVDIHAAMHRHHHTFRFLPWHRVMLFLTENMLQSIYPDVTIPYWNWTNSSEQSIPQWLQNATPAVVTPTRTVQVTRSPGTSADLAMIASNTLTAINQNDFPNFSQYLETVIHDPIHVWVGGTMSLISTAAADPIFYMHHANIDRIWWQWQQTPQGSGKNPNLTGQDAIMDPWAFTEQDTRNIQVSPLGYTYV
ncbi:MAG: tyrosinase family protein [Nitrososphaeraceae archaeon]